MNTIAGITINTVISSLLIIFIPLILIKIFSTIDNEIKDKIKIKKSDKILIIVFGIIQAVLMSVIIQNKEVQLINLAIMMGYLVFMSYTDQKTGLVYSIASFVMIVMQVVMLITQFSLTVKNLFSYITLVIPIVIYMLSLLGMIGFGDVLIYMVIAIYYLTYSEYCTMTLIITILVTNIMFLIVNLIVKIVKHDKEKHHPLTIYITISAFICSILLI